MYIFVRTENDAERVKFVVSAVASKLTLTGKTVAARTSRL
jgi:hypothetical protein